MRSRAGTDRFDGTVFGLRLLFREGWLSDVATRQPVIPDGRSDLWARHQGWRGQAEGCPGGARRSRGSDRSLESAFGNRTSRAIDLRTIDRHALASVGTLVLGLRCSWCPGIPAACHRSRRRYMKTFGDG
jgi:hypothetical protein